MIPDFDGFVDQQRHTQFLINKQLYENERKAMTKAKNAGEIAALSRYMELNHRERIENVKLPSLYTEKGASERREDETDLLEKF